MGRMLSFGIFFHRIEIGSCQWLIFLSSCNLSQRNQGEQIIATLLGFRLFPKEDCLGIIFFSLSLIAYPKEVFS